VREPAALARLGAAIEGAAAALAGAHEARGTTDAAAALAAARGAQEAVLALLAVGAECGLDAAEGGAVAAGFDALALLRGGARACQRALEAGSCAPPP
jgi:hypothetical protein